MHNHDEDYNMKFKSVITCAAAEREIDREPARFSHGGDWGFRRSKFGGNPMRREIL